MQHDRNTNTGTHIGRTCRQKAKLAIESKVQIGTQRIIQVIKRSPQRLQSHTASEHLKSEVILFINHDGLRFGGRNTHATTTFAGRMMATDQVALHQ